MLLRRPPRTLEGRLRLWLWKQRTWYGSYAPCGVPRLLNTAIPLLVAFFYAAGLALLVEPVWGLSTAAGLAVAGIAGWIVLLILVSFVRASVSDPGEVPPAWREWDGDPATVPDAPGYAVGAAAAAAAERYCDSCKLFKPPRAHHCKRCERCVARMDHHCVWLMGCVGEGNWKFFFVFLVHIVAGLAVFVGVGVARLRVAGAPHPATLEGAALYGGLAGAAFLLRAVGGLAVYQLGNASRNVTQIEEMFEPPESLARYSRGDAYANLCAALGPDPLLWLLPLSP